jgi:hypothetical protein
VAKKRKAQRKTAAARRPSLDDLFGPMVKPDVTGLKAQQAAEEAAWRQQVREVELSELQREIQQLKQQQAAKPTVESVIAAFPTMQFYEVERELKKHGLKCSPRTWVRIRETLGVVRKRKP